MKKLKFWADVGRHKGHVYGIRTSGLPKPIDRPIGEWVLLVEKPKKQNRPNRYTKEHQ